jgi:hypothetical protein
LFERRRVARIPGKGKGNSTEGYYEIPIDDLGSVCADQHFERDSVAPGEGWLLQRRRLLQGEQRLLQSARSRQEISVGC